MGRIGHDLIAQARMLAQCEPRRPRQATLRRTVSTAYYGIFHFLTEESTILLFGTGHGDDAFRKLAARSFDHGKMKSLCKEFLKKEHLHSLLQPFWQRFGIATNERIRLVADTFINLQDERHKADYDLTKSYSRQDALNAIMRAESALAAWRQLRDSNPNICRLFAMSLILWPSLASR